jgi:hypothetical protein
MLQLSRLRAGLGGSRVRFGIEPAPAGKSNLESRCEQPVSSPVLELAGSLFFLRLAQSGFPRCTLSETLIGSSRSCPARGLFSKHYCLSASLVHRSGP